MTVATRAAAVALGGGVVTLACDALLVTGPGPGGVLSDPLGRASFLANGSPERLALGTVLGSLAIASWGLSMPALVRLTAPAGASPQWLVGMVHVWFVGECVAFHVATGCLAWIGARGSQADTVEFVEALLAQLQVATGATTLTLAVALAVASWRGRPRVPKSLALVSPLIAFSALAAPSRLLPAPFGAGAAMLASTAGGLVWLASVWAWSRAADEREAP